MSFDYIAIEGPIGVGKTTLAHRLSNALDATLLLEEPADNPFLERFYANPRAWALSTQLSFLLQRARQLRDLEQGDLFRRTLVGDFMLAKDRIFAQLTLESDELALYEQVFEHVIERQHAPDAVIYLHAPVEVLLERIANRGIEYEQTIPPDYLLRLADAYQRFFTDAPPTRLLWVDAVAADFVHRHEHLERLVRRLDDLPIGRHYFDPAGS
ncbi:MAG: deoxynucleoside kinase [Gammaproteobacteria bacterium]|nr:deoxynucleoside kinase [Gammaproteobacteria bacterium]